MARQLTATAPRTNIVGVPAPRVLVLGLLLVPLASLGARLEAQAAPPLASFDSAWAAISRTYWDTAFLSSRWRGAHDSLRAALGSAPDDDAVRRAIRALIAVPRQSHFVLIPASAVPSREPRAGTDARGPARPAPGTSGLELRSVGGEVVAWRVTPASGADAAGIRPGDRISRIAGRDLDSARRALREGALAAVEAERLVTRLTLGALTGMVGDTVPLVVQGTRGRPRAVRLVLGPVTERVTQVGNLPPFGVRASRDSLPLPRDAGWIAVIRFSAWFPALSAELDSILFSSRSAAGIILDLRGNPGGIIGMLAGVSGHLLDTAVSLGTLRGRGSTIRFVANPRRVDAAGRPFPPFRGPVAVLTDELTGSTSEFFAAGMQALGRARVFGDRTAGQSLPALMGRLPNDDVLVHAIADHEDAAGRRIEGVGVVPDVPLAFTRAHLRTGRDPVLAAARDWIARQAR